MKFVQYLFFFTGVLCSLHAVAQPSNYALERKNSVNITSAGLGLHISANYGRILSIQPNYFLEASGGIGRTYGGKKGLSFPHQATINIGTKDKFLEGGLGGTYWRGTVKETNEKKGSYHLVPIIGFRKIFYNHYYMRLHFSPLLRLGGQQFIGSKRFVPYFGGTFGYTF